MVRSIFQAESGKDSQQGWNCPGVISQRKKFTWEEFYIEEFFVGKFSTEGVDFLVLSEKRS
jgi:hypothetical protein